MLSLFVLGCSERTSINSPENSVNTSEPIDAQPILMQESYNNETSNSVNLPYELYVEKAINGAQGGSVELQGQYINAYGDIVTVNSKLSIPSNAFFGIKVISIRTDSYSPVLSFQPNSFFNNKLTLDCKFVGMQLARYNLKSGRTDFVYMSDNNLTFEVVKTDGLSINLENNTAEVKGAKLEHFSRYGFIRKTTTQSIKSSAE